MPRYEILIYVRVFLEANDEEEAAEMAVERIRSPLVDRDNVETVEQAELAS